MKKAVGFDQKLQEHQLDYMARGFARAESRQQLYDMVDHYLMADIAGARSRAKARTILFKIWVLVDTSHTGLRDRAVQLFQHADKEERLLLHWGMMMLAYPFWRDMADQAGRLLQFHGEFASAQLSRKMFALYGERRRVSVSVGAVLGTFKALGVIAEQNKTYAGAGKLPVRRTELKLWLLEALLLASERSAIELRRSGSEPCLFPFELDITESEARSGRLQVTRQGLDTVMAGL